MRHSSATVRLARTMYGDGDAFTPTQIARYLAEQGVKVHRNTIRLWVVPGEAERHRRAGARYYRERRMRSQIGSGGRVRITSKTPLLDRMRELHGAGIGCSSIAKIIRLDHGIAMKEEQVRYYLRHGKEPRHPKRKQRVAGVA